ncbi:MAG TPA: disulfide oxidoreductase [Candidatus Paceibacterota bacterium]|nr:disulfide oxidoreductase [Candidatus Paceibacterota bacterium]
MQALAENMNLVWSVLSVVAQLLALFLIAALFSPAVRSSAIVKFLRERALLLGFVVSLLATAGSLIYSDVIGFAPCKLCWFQRIFMYPQVVLMGIALWRKDLSMRLYGLVLSAIGAAIALYHYLGQNGVASLPCSAVGYSVSCAEKYVMEFGYITIPVMALSAFVLMALAHAVSLRADREAHGQ